MGEGRFDPLDRPRCLERCSERGTIVHEFKLVEFLDFVEKIAIKWDHG